MTRIDLSIEPVFIGPCSFGTVEVIRLIRTHCGLGLSQACNLVSRAVFEGERVSIPMPDTESADRLAAALAQLPSRPKLTVSVHKDDSEGQ